MRALRSLGLLVLVSVFLSILVATPAVALPPTDGWAITLVPGTDKIDTWRDLQIPDGAIGPGPDIFDPEVALDGDRVVYSARYEGQPQIYVYEISSGKVTQLTDDQGTSFGRPQVSGEWAVWLADGGHGDIYLHDFVSGATRQFPTQGYVESYRLVGDRLVWEESPRSGPRLWLYDPSLDSPQAIAAATGVRTYDMDARGLVWVGGADHTELFLYDLATKKTAKLLEAAQPVESVRLRGQVVAWAERTGDRTTVRAYRLDRGAGGTKTLDTFGPFNPEIQTDGRYVVWTGGEEATGPRAKVYDTETDHAFDLGGPDSQGTAASLYQGRAAWARFFSGRGRSVVMVKDLGSGLTTQLSSGPFDSQPPVMSGGTLVWALHNPDYRSPSGHGVLVATSPATPPAPAFADLDPSQLYRTAIEWLGEAGYATGYPGAAGQGYRSGQPLLRSQLALLVCRVFAIPILDAPVHFADFDTGEPGNPLPAQAQATLAELGIFRGTGDGWMQAYAPVSRAQAITVFVRAFDYIHPGLLPEAPGGWVEPKFTDPPHGDNVTRAGWDCLLDGLEGCGLYRGKSWVPWDIWTTATRGEVAQLLWNAAGVYLQP